MTSALLAIYGLTVVVAVLSIAMEDSDRKLKRLPFLGWTSGFLVWSALTGRLMGDLIEGSNALRDNRGASILLLALVNALVIFFYCQKIVHRARDAGQPKWLPALFIVPFLGIFVLIYLLIAPSGEEKQSKEESRKNASGGRPSIFPLPADERAAAHGVSSLPTDYFLGERRVDVQAPAPDTHPAPSDRDLATSIQPATFDEDSAYAAALKEIRDNNVKDADWARAFSASDGDQSRAQALYIKLSVERARHAAAKDRAKTGGYY